MWSACLSWIVCAAPQAGGPELRLEPERTWPVGVALVVDADALDEGLRTALLAWRRAREEEGISTWLVAQRWTSALAVRDELTRLRAAQPSIEGVFLLGDVPGFVWHDDLSSIPAEGVASDVPYADLDLLLESVPTGDPQDAQRRSHVRASADSPQRIQKDVYVGRFTPSGDPQERRALARAYLERTTAGTALAPRVLMLGDEACEYAWFESLASDLRAAWSGGAAVHAEVVRAPRRVRARFAELACDSASDVLVFVKAPGPAVRAPASPAWPPPDRALGVRAFVAPAGFPGEDEDAARGSATAACARAGAARVAWIGSERTGEIGAWLAGAPLGRVDLVESDPRAAFVGDPTVRLRAATPRVHPDAARDPSTDDETLAAMRSAAAPAATRIGALRAHVSRHGAAAAAECAALVERDPSALVRLVALECLARTRAPELARTLPVALRDASALVRAAGVRLMGATGRAEDAERLARHLGRDASARVDREVVLTLARFPEDVLAGIDPRVFGAGDRAESERASPDPAWESEGLGRAGLAVEAERMRALVHGLEAPDTRPVERVRLAQEAGRARPLRALGVLLGFARDPGADLALRRACVRALAGYAYTPARETVAAELARIAGAEGVDTMLRADARRAARRLEDGPDDPLAP